MGLPELGNCLHAAYRGQKGSENYELFVIVPPANRSAATIWNSLGRHWKPFSHKELALRARTVPYRGAAVIARSKTGLFGASHPRGKLAAAQVVRRLMGGP